MFKGLKPHIILALIPIIACTIAIFIINGSKTPGIVQNAEVVRPGYETMPANVELSASSSYEWNHGGKKKGLILVGYLIFVAGSLYSYEKDVHAEKASPFAVFISWVIGAVLIFGFFAATDHHDTLTPEQYQSVKDNPDHWFDQKAENSNTVIIQQ